MQEIRQLLENGLGLAGCFDISRVIQRSPSSWEVRVFHQITPQQESDVLRLVDEAKSERGIDILLVLPQRLIPGLNQTRENTPYYVTPSPYVYRVEIDGVACQISFATLAEMLSYIDADAETLDRINVEKSRTERPK